MRIYTKEVGNCEDCPEYFPHGEKGYCERSKREIGCYTNDEYTTTIPDWCELASRGYAPREMEE